MNPTMRSALISALKKQSEQSKEIYPMRDHPVKHGKHKKKGKTK